jgi:hypothetical protein
MVPLPESLHVPECSFVVEGNEAEDFVAVQPCTQQLTIPFAFQRYLPLFE